MRRGWEAARTAKETHRGGSNQERTFWIPPGTETTVVLLDDTPNICYRHQLFIKGDKQAAGMRQTCADSDSDDDVPRTCLVCNAMIRHKQIGRKPFIYLSIIDERQYAYNGKEYKDMKQLLELDKKGAEIFDKRKQAHGSLAGMRFRVYRSSAQNSPRYGDSWEKLDVVDPVTHLWYSPAIPKIIEKSSRRGDRPISHEQAVGELISPYDYETIMGAYKPIEAERFVAYLQGEAAMQGGGQGSGGPGGYQAPPPPPGRSAPPQQQQAPQYAPQQHQGVPASQVPQYAPQQAPAPQGYAPPPPPRVPDPRGATAPQGMGGYPAQTHDGRPQGGGPPQYQAPPPPQRQQAPPQGQQHRPAPPSQPPAYTPPPPPGIPAGPPPGYGTAPPPAPGLPPQANAYDFERQAPQGGWSNTPPGFAPPPPSGQPDPNDMELPF
jgi:hypothetical protein